MENDGRLTPAEERALKALREAASQTACLDALEALLKQYFDLDGYAINLLLSEENALLCQRIQLPPALIGIAEAYAQTRTPLNSDSLSARAFATGIPIGITASNAHEFPESARLALSTLAMKHMLFLPIRVGGSGQTPIGVLTLFSQRGAIHPLTLRRISRLLEEAAALLQLHQKIADWEARADAIGQREAQLQSLLAFIADLGHPGSESELYRRIQSEFIDRFALDLSALLLPLADGSLQVVDTRIVGEAEWLPRWQAHCAELVYSPTLADGASSIAMSYNQPLFFGDIPAAQGLAMSEKDRANLDILSDLLSFGIFPLRHHGQAVGLLWLGSRQRKHALDSKQLQSVQNLCDVIGTAIENGRAYLRLQQEVAAARVQTAL